MPPTKPGRWAVSPAEIDPQWSSFWTGLIFCAPLMEGSGLRAFDHAGRIMSSTNSTGGAWEPSTHGRGWSTYNTAGRMTFDAAPGASIPPRGDSEISVFVAGRMSQVGNLTNAVITFGVDDFAVAYSLSINYAGIDDWAFNNAASLVATWPAAEDGEVHTIGVSRQVGGATRFIADGVFQAEVTGDATLSGAGDDNILLGGAIRTNSTRMGVNTAIAYVWDRVLSDEELIRLHADPFGPVRPAPIFGGLTVTLFATADGTITSVVDETDGTTDIWQSIDDDPATPTDTDWVNNNIDPGTVTAFFDVTDVPADFGTADTATIIVRTRGQNWGGGTRVLLTQIFQSNESTTMSDEVTVATVTANGSFDNTASLTITGLDTTSGKSVWDAARLRFRWT